MMFRERLTIWTHLGLLGWSLGMSAALPDKRLPCLLALLLIVGWLVNPAGLRLLLTFRFWSLFLIAFFVGMLWLGEGEPSAGIIQGLLIGLRAATLVLGFHIAASAMSVSGWAGVFATLGLPGLGFALGVAFNLLSTLQGLGEAAYQSIRLRGGLRRPLLACRLFLLTVAANALRYGDEVVIAASSRAYDPSSCRYRTVLPAPTDYALLSALIIAGAAMLFWR